MRWRSCESQSCAPQGAWGQLARWKASPWRPLCSSAVLAAAKALTPPTAHHHFAPSRTVGPGTRDDSKGWQKTPASKNNCTSTKSDSWPTCKNLVAHLMPQPRPANTMLIHPPYKKARKSARVNIWFIHLCQTTSAQQTFRQ